MQVTIGVHHQGTTDTVVCYAVFARTTAYSIAIHLPASDAPAAAAATGADDEKLAVGLAHTG